MTADEFVITHKFRDCFGIAIRDGQTRFETVVDERSFEEELEYNLEDFSQMLERILTKRVEEKWSFEEISDEDKAAFIRILREVLP